MTLIISVTCDMILILTLMVTLMTLMVTLISAW